MKSLIFLLLGEFHCSELRNRPRMAKRLEGYDWLIENPREYFDEHGKVRIAPFRPVILPAIMGLSGILVGMVIGLILHSAIDPKFKIFNDPQLLIAAIALCLMGYVAGFLLFRWSLTDAEMILSLEGVSLRRGRLGFEIPWSVFLAKGKVEERELDRIEFPIADASPEHIAAFKGDRELNVMSWKEKPFRIIEVKNRLRGRLFDTYAYKIDDIHELIITIASQI